MTYREILYSTVDGVATITLNRPDKVSAWTPLMAEEVRGAAMNAGRDEDVRVIILVGSGRGFCAGADMSVLKSVRQDVPRRQQYERVREFVAGGYIQHKPEVKTSVEGLSDFVRYGAFLNVAPPESATQ